MDFPEIRPDRRGAEAAAGRQSVFLTNGETWERQRRIIDPAFEGGRLRDTFPAMWDAGLACVERLRAKAGAEPIEIEAECSPCGRRCDLPHAVLDPDRARGRAAPCSASSAPISAPSRSSISARCCRCRAGSRASIRAATTEHGAADPVADRAADRRARGGDRGRTGARRSRHQDHDHARPADRRASSTPTRWSTRWRSSSSPGTRPGPRRWAGRSTCWRSIPTGRTRVAAEADAAIGDEIPDFSIINKLKLSRAVFREALRLYPPVPMMVREATGPETLPRPRVSRPGRRW